MNYVWIWIAFVVGLVAGSSGKQELRNQIDFYKSQTIECPLTR